MALPALVAIGMKETKRGFITSGWDSAKSRPMQDTKSLTRLRFSSVTFKSVLCNRAGVNDKRKKFAVFLENDRCFPLFS